MGKCLLTGIDFDEENPREYLSVIYGGIDGFKNARVKVSKLAFELFGAGVVDGVFDWAVEKGYVENTVNNQLDAVKANIEAGLYEMVKNKIRGL